MSEAKGSTMRLIERRRDLLGAAVAVLGMIVLSAVMLPLRRHLSVPTPALVLVLPVVAGAAIGGFVAGAVAVGAGFLAFDLVFIPPYYSLEIGAAENWIALGVYFVVMLVVARLVSHLRETQVEARRHADATQRIFDLSDALIRDRPFDEFLQRVATTFLEAFHLRSVALLLPLEDALQLVATAGEEFSEAELSSVLPTPGTLRPLSAASIGRGAIVVVPLRTSGGPLGLIALGGATIDRFDMGLLRTYANQVALALERAQLREQAIRTRLLEEVDQWRDALIGAVSHDLRTPLAVIKAAVSDLRDDAVQLDEEARDELLRFIEDQSDRLARLVANILDMTRVRAGALTPRIAPTSIGDLVREALAALARGIGARVDAAVDDAPLVAADHVLIAQVLANLLENADRHAPGGTRIEVAATAADSEVEISVTDHGDGVAPQDSDRIFDMFSRVSGAGRAGLGLAIAKAFVEAHGGTIGVTNAPGGGARFAFTIGRSSPGSSAARAVTPDEGGAPPRVAASGSASSASTSLNGLAG